jgi:hypothetical protein
MSMLNFMPGVERREAVYRCFVDIAEVSNGAEGKLMFAEGAQQLVACVSIELDDCEFLEIWGIRNQFR